MSEWKRTGWVLVLAAAALAALRALTVVNSDRRGLEFFPDMARSCAAESYAPSDLLPGGTTQQPLVVGTVVRGSEPFPFEPTPAGAIAAGEQLANPFRADDAAARARGADRFANFCVVCHGADGLGRGPAVARGMPPPPSLLADRTRALRDGQLFHVLTCGQGGMASYAAVLTPADRWKLILHVRALQAGGAP